MGGLCEWLEFICYREDMRNAQKSAILRSVEELENF